MSAELLAAIHADLADDELRLVYADALLEADDPRGEHIVLQLNRARAGGKRTAREVALERIHARSWVGPAGAWLGPKLRYERGFLVAAAHGGRPTAISAKSIGAPVWTTLEELDMTKATAESAVAFLSHPVLGSLHTLTGVLASTLVAIKGRSLCHVGLRSIDVAPSRIVTALAKHKQLESLDLGGVPDPELMILAAARLPQLKTIAFRKRRFERAGKDAWKEIRK